MTTFVVKEATYEIPGWVYDEERPQFKYFIPEFTGHFYIVDCLICDEHGNRHPHYVSGVPIETEGMVRFNKNKSNNI
jgi:hypothetical protein